MSKILPKSLEPFLPDSSDTERSDNRCSVNVTTNSKDKEWGYKRTNKLLKIQLYALFTIFWLGVLTYGCDFPVKVVFNQVALSIYFLLIYAFGMIIGHYVKDNVSLAGVRIVALLQCITIFAAGYFQLIGFVALRDHQLHDRNSVTRIWAAAVYTTTLLSHFLVFLTSLALTLTAIRSSCKKSKNKSNTDQSPPEAV